MTTETIRVKVPIFSTVIEIGGKDLTLHFRELKRNEKLKEQIDLESLGEIFKKEKRSAEEDKLIKDYIKRAGNKHIELLENVDGDVVISNEKVTIESIRKGELPEYLYDAIYAAFKALTGRYASLEAEPKNAQAGGSPNGLISS